METNTRVASARAFVRSLNILLKFAKMYDFGHPRTVSAYGTAWRELRAAIGDNETGLLLAASGDKLLLDGVPLDTGAAEKSFALLLSNAGIASVHFASNVSQATMGKFVKAFPTGGAAARAQVLAAQLKTGLADAPGIHLNEVCYVPADSAVAKGQVAEHISRATLGLNTEQCNELFKDPRILLQLIGAVEGSRVSQDGSGVGGFHGGGYGPGGGSVSGGPGGGWSPAPGSGAPGTGGSGDGSGLAGGTGGGRGTGGPGGGWGPGPGSGAPGTGGSGDGSGLDGGNGPGGPAVEGGGSGGFGGYYGAPSGSLEVMSGSG